MEAFILHAESVEAKTDQQLWHLADRGDYFRKAITQIVERFLSPYHSTSERTTAGLMKRFMAHALWDM